MNYLQVRSFLSWHSALTLLFRSQRTTHDVNTTHPRTLPDLRLESALNQVVRPLLIVVAASKASVDPQRLQTRTHNVSHSICSFFVSLSLVLVLQVVSTFHFLVLRFLSSALKFLVLPSDPSSSQDTSVQRRLRQQMPTRSHRYATNADRILIPVRISPFWDWCLPGCRVLSAADSHLAQRLG